MSGLILKDLLYLRKGSLSILIIGGFYCLMAVVGAWSVSFLGGFLAVLVTMLPFNCFAYDHTAKWDVYAFTLPVSRNGIVAARYLTVLILTAAGALLALLAGAVAALFGRMDDWQTYLVTCLVVLALGLLINAVMLPLLYKFGAERARIIFYGVLAGVIAVGILVVRLLGGAAFLDSLDLNSSTFCTAATIAAIGGGAVLLALSFLLSRYFYGKREV